MEMTYGFEKMRVRETAFVSGTEELIEDVGFLVKSRKLTEYSFPRALLPLTKFANKAQILTCVKTDDLDTGRLQDLPREVTDNLVASGGLEPFCGRTPVRY
jgi:hypothetical protein